MGYRTHIKIADRGWILEKCASEIARRSSRVTYGREADSSADIQYYINYSARRQRVSPVEITFFTHSERDEGARRRFFDNAAEVDHCVCMSKRYTDELIEAGVRNVTTIAPGVDLDTFKPKIRVGVVGRAYHTGRKGEALVAEVMDVSGIEWRFTGSGWPAPSTHIPDKSLADFYNDLDYVLVPALYEGGPMCALEGLACGVPIISSDVGWVYEYPHIPFDNGSAASLRRVLEGLVAERMKLRECVVHRTWDAWAEQHLELFDQLAPKRNCSTSTAMTSATKGAEKQYQRKYTIVSHGTEKTTRGGPTSRIANTVKVAAEMGVDIDIVSTIQPQIVGDKEDITHIFNSWPLKSTLEQLNNAKQAKRTVVYSPIAINLSYLPYYQKALPALLQNANAGEQIEEGADSIRQLTAPFSPKAAGAPPEGWPGHFQALQQGVCLADHVIFLSEYERAFLTSIGAQPAQSTIIRNGVDTAIMAAGDAAIFKNRFGISDFVLFVGRIESRKNQALAAFALRNLKAPFVCIGHVGDKSYFNLLKRWAGPNFVHIDRIEDRALMAAAYKAARCVVLNSWAEGAPLVALEAAAAGTPLVLSNMAAEQEYLGELATYVHPCDLEGFRQAVSETIENPETESERQARSDVAVEKYDIKRHTEKTLALYDSILREQAGKTIKSKSKTETFISLDITHLGHQLVNSGILTGVTAVEYSLAKAVLRARPKTPAYIWNSTHRIYLETSIDDLEAPGGARIASASDIVTPDENVIHIAGVEVSLPGVRSDRRLTPRRVAISAFKQSLNTLPRPLHSMCVNLIKAVRPQFDSAVLPEHRLFRAKKESFARRDEKGPGSLVGVSPAFDVVANVRDLRDGRARSGSRLLLLGQPWISNDRMLADLCSVVRTNNMRLWAHVPDIVYVTDSEAFDFQTRKKYRERLTKLLTVTETAIAISDQAENDLRQFIAANDLDVRTKRIRLGVSEELVAAEPRRPQRLLPPRFVMFVSSMNNRKRHSFMRDVWSDVYRDLCKHEGHSDIGLLFVGSPQHGYEPYGEAAFQAELAQDNIFVLNEITSQELSWLYRECLFTVYPPRAEGWGLPPIESLSFGKPCIVSSSVPSAIETQCPALVKTPANDYFQWYNMVKSLVLKQDLRQALMKKAEEFTPPSWDEAAQVLLSPDE